MKDLPVKIFIPKEEIVISMKEDIQKQLVQPKGTKVEVDYLEWTDKGIMVHLKYEYKE